MKILIILFLAIPFIGLSQNYHPFPTENAIWKEYRYHFWAGGGGNKQEKDTQLHYSMNGDTTINGKAYKNIYYTATIFQEGGDPPYYSSTTYHNNEYIGSIREDSSKRIFILSPNETNEMLLYDFNLSIGDTITSNFIDHLEYPNAHFTVESIDSVLVMNNFHKSYHISAPTSSEYYTSLNHFNDLILIEGIGSSLGLFQFRYKSNFNNIHKLECFKQDQISAYPSGDSCTIIFDVGIQDISLPEVKLFPNPTSDILHLNLKKNYANLLINIYSLDGKLVDTFIKQNTNQAEISFKSGKGMYFIEIFLDGQKSIHKIIKN